MTRKARAVKKQRAELQECSALDGLMIPALLDSLGTIFDTMVGEKIYPGAPVLKQGNAALGEVTGLIGMRSDSVSGSIALTFNLPTMRVISLNLMGHELTSIGKDAADLTGELINMLAGGAKRVLSEQGHEFDMQTPQMLLGEGHEIVHHRAGNTVLLPVWIGAGEFYIELNFV
ncbi:MAG TPA: chemotaxis protein CheX [Sideroxyarcus sp.]|nr:chemotaxis protein CheX [Sideroxyarcus sp.]